MERFTAVYEYDGEWWIGYVEEVPGANTQGRTLDEARDNLKDAVQLLIESNRQEIQPLSDGKHVVCEELRVPVS
jgi:predicted RNase H-like HicB family nuclease